MIVVIADDGSAAARCAQAITIEGATAVAMATCDFDDWLSTATEADLCALKAVLISDCRQAWGLVPVLRRRSQAALIAIGHDASLQPTLAALAAGFDDVVDGTCPAREILARVAAIMRRLSPRSAARCEQPAVKVFMDGRQPLVGALAFELPHREQQILAFLVLRAGQRLSQRQITLAVYGVSEQETHGDVIELHICRLRKRLRERLGYDPINFRRHQGYLLDCRAVKPDASQVSGLR